VLIDRTHKKWLAATSLLVGVATLVYIPYRLHAPQGPSGGSALGLAFGILGSACMVFAGLLGARKKVPVWRVGRAQTWMRGHLWLGLLSLPLILFHGGFRFGGPLTSVLMVLFIIVIVSGVLGAALQHYLPRVMTLQVPMETIYEEIESVRAQLREEADRYVAVVCGPQGVAAESRKALAAGSPATAAAVAVGEEESAPLRNFYLREMLPFLENPGARHHPLGDPGQARGAFEHLRAVLPPALGDTLTDLEDICEEERQLTRQLRLHHWLHGWLLVHVPLSLALLLLGAVHAVMALRY